MLRSMFTAISALTLHQDFLDVVADNLANANTPGFKSGRVLFQDQFAQIMSPGSAPTTTIGGVNPTQIGLGLKLGNISQVFTQGMMQSTGRNLDVAIQGDGFFMYNSPNGMRYSREGSMTIDSSGNLVNGSTGFFVQGWTLAAGATTPINTNAAPGNITVNLDQTLASPTTNVTMGGNLDSTTATPYASNTYTTTVNVYDSLGASHSLGVTFTRATDSSWNWAVSSPTGAAGSGTINFGADGQATGTPIFTNAVTIPGTNGAAGITATLDLSKVTMLATANSVSATSQNGLEAGSITDLFIAPNSGEIYLVYSNGLKQLAGQIAMARFTNPSGLIRDGNTSFQEGLNSGTPQVGAANTGGRGALVSGYNEASNVDMAQEFTNMILAQRGFQASTRVITTSDEILQELVNLKR